MATALRVDGADISHHQSSVNLGRAAEAGLKFLYHKVTEGSTFLDPKYESRKEMARVVKLPFGAYHFARFTSMNDARVEARFFVSKAQLKPGNLLPVLDVETTEGMTLAEIKACSKAFVDEVKKLTGFDTMFYTPYDLKLPGLYWRPRYNPGNELRGELAPPKLPWHIWQFSDGKLGLPDSFPGLDHVDLNTFAKGQSVDDILIKAPEPAKPPPKPEPEKPENKPMPIRQNFVDASHNMWFRLAPEPGRPATKWLEDLTKSGKADLVGYQEADGDPQRAVLREFCETNDRALYHPANRSLAISFKRETFDWLMIDGHRFRGAHRSHASAINMGIPAKFNPPRDFIFVGVVHKETGQKILRINVHPLAGATLPEDNPRNKDSERLAIFKDWAIAQYWLDVVAFTATEMTKQTIDPQSITPFWDAIICGGDYNAYLDRNNRWYYPANLLESLYRPDQWVKGLDHFQQTYGSDVVQHRRWPVPGHTDHDIHFCDWTLKEIVDQRREI